MVDGGAGGSGLVMKVRCGVVEGAYLAKLHPHISKIGDITCSESRLIGVDSNTARQAPMQTSGQIYTFG